MTEPDGTAGSAEQPAPPPPPPPAAWPEQHPGFGPPPGYGAPPGYGQQPGYGPPGYNPQWQQQPYAMPATNGMAIASLVLGILWLYWVGSILALVFGYIARRQIDESAGRQSGRGMAVAGIVLGWIGVGFLALAIVFGIGFLALGSF